MMLYDTVRREVIIGTVDFVYFFYHLCIFYVPTQKWDYNVVPRTYSNHEKLA